MISVSPNSSELKPYSRSGAPVWLHLLTRSGEAPADSFDSCHSSRERLPTSHASHAVLLRRRQRCVRCIGKHKLAYARNPCPCGRCSICLRDGACHLPRARNRAQTGWCLVRSVPQPARLCRVLACRAEAASCCARDCAHSSMRTRVQGHSAQGMVYPCTIPASIACQVLTSITHASGRPDVCARAAHERERSYCARTA